MAERQRGGGGGRDPVTDEDGEGADVKAVAERRESNITILNIFFVFFRLFYVAHWCRLVNRSQGLKKKKKEHSRIYAWSQRNAMALRPALIL